MVYVDKPQHLWKGQLWGHMVAPTLDELHAFSKKLGMHPGWVQVPPKARYPHFDLNISKFQKALSLGAVIGDKRTIIDCAKACEVEYYENLEQGKTVWYRLPSPTLQTELLQRWRHRQKFREITDVLQTKAEVRGDDGGGGGSKALPWDRP